MTDQDQTKVTIERKPEPEKDTQEETITLTDSAEVTIERKPTEEPDEE